MITHWELGTDKSALGQDEDTLYVLSWCCRAVYEELNDGKTVRCAACQSEYDMTREAPQSFKLDSFSSAWDVEAWIMAVWGVSINVVLRMA